MIYFNFYLPKKAIRLFGTRVQIKEKNIRLTQLRRYLLIGILKLISMSLDTKEIPGDKKSYPGPWVYTTGNGSVTDYIFS